VSLNQFRTGCCLCLIQHPALRGSPGRPSRGFFLGTSNGSLAKHNCSFFVCADEDALTGAIVALACKYGRYGYRRITRLLNDKRQSGIRRGRDRADVPQCPLDAQFPQYLGWLRLRLCTTAAQARHLGRHPALAADTSDRRLSRLLIRWFRRIYSSHELRRRRSVDGVSCLTAEQRPLILTGEFDRLRMEPIRSFFAPPPSVR
jgi:hypothetical protein